MPYGFVLMLRLNDDFNNAVMQLSELAKLDTDFCSAEGKQVFGNAIYKSADTVSSLHSMVTTIISLKHNIAYKIFITSSTFS
jgi:hypothetical protein